ncbi:MAG: hypothetical protein Q8O11_03090 [Syntrophales bacterium]|nr:hypothetical protein [Syntrophales bacterium]
MVWRPFATKLETAETMEGVAINMRAPYFSPTSSQYLLVMAIREKVFPSDRQIMLESAPAKSTIDFIS